jgi:hypothetical protein
LESLGPPAHRVGTYFGTLAIEQPLVRFRLALVVGLESREAVDRIRGAGDNPV